MSNFEMTSSRSVKTLIVLTFLLYEFAQCTANTDNSYCEGSGWIPYKDEKCLKLITKWTTREDAQIMCRDEVSRQSDANVPVLLQIKSEQEQNFLVDFLYQTDNIQNNVWLGARRVSQNASQFEWDDGSRVDFSNWAVDAPTSNSGEMCVEMQSDVSRKSNRESNDDGKWRDVSCGVGNFVVCEKLQRWSQGKLQQTFLAVRKDIEENRNELIDTKGQLVNTQSQLTETGNQLAITKNELETLKNNPVPVGFIYVQLANQPVPKTIWPTVDWSDVTSQYAGLFFRAEGGASAAFGTIQDGDSPRLSNVETGWIAVGDTVIADTPLVPEQWTPYHRSGGGSITGIDYHAIRFLQSKTEVRPRNQAIRIWKRVA